MDREQLDYRCEKGILFLVLAILAFGPLSAGAVRTLEFLVLQGLTMAVGALWIVRIWIRPNYRLLWPPIAWSVLAFVGCAIIRYQQAEIEYVARAELIRIVIYAFLFFVVLDNFNRQESTQLLGFTLVFLGMAVALYAVYEFITNSPTVWHLLGPETKPTQYGRRGTGTYICPNHLAGFLEMVVPLALAYMLTGRFKPTTKVFLGYAATTTLIGIGVTLSRGGWLAAGISLLCFFGILMRSRTNRLPVIAVVVLLMAGGVLLFKNYQPQHRWRQMFHESGVVEDIRFYLWKPAIQIWQQHFWWGAGPGHYDYLFPAVRPAVVQMRAGYAHNDYLNALADWGLAGTALIALSWVFLYWGVFKTWRFVRRANDFGSRPSNRSSFVLGAGIGLFALLLHSVLDFNMQIPANAILAVALMAMLTGHLRFATERYWVNPGLAIRAGLTALGVVGLAFLGTQTLTRWREQRQLDLAGRMLRVVEQRTQDYTKALAGEKTETGPVVDFDEVNQMAGEINAAVKNEIAALKHAHTLEPMNFETTYRLGETYRKLSMAGQPGYRDAAKQAMNWFVAGMRLNPLDAYNYMRNGMCLDWLGRHVEAEPYFKRAVELDPKNYFVVLHFGWHLFTAGKYAEAKVWFEKSLQLSDWRDNPIAHNYLAIIERKLTEKPPIQ